MSGSEERECQSTGVWSGNDTHCSGEVLVLSVVPVIFAEWKSCKGVKIGDLSMCSLIVVELFIRQDISKQSRFRK